MRRTTKSEIKLIPNMKVNMSKRRGREVGPRLANVGSEHPSCQIKVRTHERKWEEMTKVGFRRGRDKSCWGGGH